MATLEEFQNWIQTYAKLFAVISAGIVLLSWLIENLWSKQLDLLQSNLNRLQLERNAARRHQASQSKLFEIFRISRSLEKRLNGHSLKTKEIEESLDKAYLAGDFISISLDYANTLLEQLPGVKPPSDLQNEVDNNYEKLRYLITKFNTARDTYKSTQKLIIGELNYIPIDTIGDKELVQLKIVANNFAVISDKIVMEHSDVANEMNDIYFKVFDFVAKKISKIETIQRKVRYAQLTFFIGGTLLSIYGTYLGTVN